MPALPDLFPQTMDLFLALFEAREVLELVHQAVDLDPAQGHFLDLPEDLPDIGGGEETDPRLLRIRCGPGDGPIREEQTDQELERIGTSLLLQVRFLGCHILPEGSHSFDLDAEGLQGPGTSRGLRGRRRRRGKDTLQFLPRAVQLFHRKFIPSAFPRQPSEEEEELNPLLQGERRDRIGGQPFQGGHGVGSCRSEADPVQRLLPLSQQGPEHRCRLRASFGRDQDLRPGPGGSSDEDPASSRISDPPLHPAE